MQKSDKVIIDDIIQDEFEDVPEITDMIQLNPGETITKAEPGDYERMKAQQTRTYSSTKPSGPTIKNPLSTSTNKDRKAKKARRQNKKRGRKNG